MNIPQATEELKTVVDLRSIPLAYLIPAIFIPALALPYFATSYFFVNTLIYALLFIGLGQSWNIIGGYAGQISLGHAVMFATGAYTTAILFTYYGITPYLGLIVAGLLAAAVGLTLGALTFRLRYHYFSIATLAATLGIYVIFLQWDWIGGAVGLEYPIAQIGDPLSLMFDSRQMYFYVMWGFALATTVLVYRLHTSKLGIYLKAIDIDQELAENAGISAFWYKMYAMGLSSFIAGVGGGLFAQYVLYVEPRILLELIRNVEFVLIPVVGGLGTVLGPVVGAVIYIFTREYTRTLLGGTQTGLSWVIFGTILVLISMYRPNGLIRRRPVIGGTKKNKTSTQDSVAPEGSEADDD
jgi:branched-chain amino acid transport system permease protein